MSSKVPAGFKAEKRSYVINPETMRPCKVGGRVYNRLYRRGAFGPKPITELGAANIKPLKKYKLKQKGRPRKDPVRKLKRSFVPIEVSDSESESEEEKLEPIEEDEPEVAELIESEEELPVGLPEKKKPKKSKKNATGFKLYLMTRQTEFEGLDDDTFKKLYNKVRRDYFTG